jgi:hypothetical protein
MHLAFLESCKLTLEFTNMDVVLLSVNNAPNSLINAVIILQTYPGIALGW